MDEILISDSTHKKEKQEQFYGSPEYVTLWLGVLLLHK